MSDHIRGSTPRDGHSATNPATDAPPDAPAPDGGTAHIRNPDGTPIDNPSG